MAETPGADELRIRSLLRKNGVGPDAPPPEPRDWWAHQTPGAVPVEDEEPEEPEEERGDRPHAFAPQPGYWPRPHMPDLVYRTRDRAETAISPGTRRLLYNASAAGTGWGLGLYRLVADAIADCGTTTSIGGALALGAGSCLFIAHLWDRRTRHWWPPIAWVARIPLATAVCALALYAPAAP